MNRFIENHHNDRVISQEGARLLNECFGANIEIIQEEADVEMCEGIKGYGLIKKAEGIREGMCEGKREGIHEGKIQTLLELVIEGELSVETAARKAQMSVEEFQGLLAVNNN